MARTLTRAASRRQRRALSPGKKATIVATEWYLLPAVEETTQLGARLKGISIREATVVAEYTLIDPTGAELGGDGAIQISFAALDAMHQRLGGCEPLSEAERLDLAAKWLRPLFVLSFARRQDVTVQAKGVVVTRAGEA